MLVDELFGAYLRLQHELADAYAAPRKNEPHLARLAGDIQRLELALVESQPIDEQTNDMWMPFLGGFLDNSRTVE